MDIQKIRDDFPALKNYTWFQNGGVSLTPSPVAEKHSKLMREILERGPMHIVHPDEEYTRREQTMSRLAQFFSVNEGELGLMRGVSEGYQTVLRGLNWECGDQILITDQEEAALLLPSLHLRDRFGVEVVKVPLFDNIEEQIKAFSDQITGCTKLLAFSQVTTDTGFRLPVKDICNLARDRGVYTFVDMAHSAGLYPINLREIGCDFAGLLSYKWMYGPYASGALYVQNNRLHDLQVTYAGGRSEEWLDFKKDQFKLKDNTGRFQYGPWSWPLVHAWAFALDYLSSIGQDRIWTRTLVLTSRLKEGLRQIPGVRILTPNSPLHSAALVTFEIVGCYPIVIRDELRHRWNIVIKGFNNTMKGIRASVPFFLLEEEIDLLLKALNSLGNKVD